MTASAECVERIRERLQAALSPLHLEISDDSHKHAGHAGAKSGGGHFSIVLVAQAFSGQGLLQRHRMVYDALGAAMHSDIHALSLRTLTPDEFDSSTKRNDSYV